MLSCREKVTVIEPEHIRKELVRTASEIAEKYILKAIQSSCIFEINTGAIARGLRTTVYPFENLLHILRKENAPIILSSDSHSIDTLDFRFDETKKYLKDIGFNKITALVDNAFKEFNL